LNSSSTINKKVKYKKIAIFEAHGGKGIVYDHSPLVVCTEFWRKENPPLGSNEPIKATMVKRLP